MLHRARVADVERLGDMHKVAIALGHHVGRFEAPPPGRVGQLQREVRREQRRVQRVLANERL